MVDHLHIRNLPVDPDDILRNSLLTFEQKVSTDGELSGCLRAEYRGMDIWIKESDKGRRYVNLKGSLHVFWNFNKYRDKDIKNFDDFTFPQVVASIKKLETDLGFNAKYARINVLEFGVNISLHFPVNDITSGLFVLKTKKPVIEDSPGIRNSRFFELKEYTVKDYEKSLHAGIEGNIFRHEIKANSSKLKELGITNLADLLDKSKYKKIGEFLVDKWNEILFWDHRIDTNEIPEKQFRFIEEIRNLTAEGWDKRSSNQRKYDKEKFKSCVLQYSGRDLQNEIYQIIANKWHQLLNDERPAVFPMVQTSTGMVKFSSKDVTITPVVEFENKKDNYRDLLKLWGYFNESDKKDITATPTFLEIINNLRDNDCVIDFKFLYELSENIKIPQNGTICKAP